MKNKKNRKILISVGVAALLVMSVLTAAMVGVSEESEAPAVEEEITEDSEIDLERLEKTGEPLEQIEKLDVLDPELTRLLSGGEVGERGISSSGNELMTDPHTVDQHNVEAVHDMGIYGDGVQVSLMDTGFDMAHPDLIGTHAVFEFDNETMDPEMEMYDGYPIAFDPVSMADYAFDGEISQDYTNVWGGADNSWYVDTSYENTTYENETGAILANFTEKQEYVTYEMPDEVEAGETVRFGLHPDEKLHLWYGERPAVLLTQDEGGNWTNVYVDLENDRVFENETRAWIDGDNPESEVITRDLNEDGIADISGGMLYFVSDGEMPIPYSQHFRETMNKIINLFYGYEPGTIADATGVAYEDAWEYVIGEEFHTTPGDGDMIALMGDFNSFGAYGAHGTWTASAVAGQGVTGVPQEMIIDENETTPYPPTPEGSGGLPRGLAPNATIIPMGRFFDALPMGNPLAEVPASYSSLFFSAEGYTGNVSITSDSADIASSSFGYTVGENHGGFHWYERLFDWVGTQYTQNTLFINSQGNEGSGFGTVSSPSGAQGVMSAGASGNQLYRVDPWRMDDEGPNPWYGEVTGMTSTGPHSKGSHGPDIMTNGQFGYGADPINAQLANIGGFQGNNSWTLWSGTSLSAPNAAGIAALVFQAYEEAHGEAPCSQTLKNLVMQGADDMKNSPHLQGPGEANAYDSVMIAQKEGLYSEEFQWRPGTNPEMAEHVEHHVNIMEPEDEVTDQMTLHNWNETDDIDYNMGAYKQEKVGNTSIDLSSGMGGPHGDGRVPLIMINETGIYELIYNETNDNWNISDEPIATLDDPDADLFRFGTHTPYENHDWWDYILAEFYNWEDVNDNGSFDGLEERNRIGYTFASLRAVGIELTSDYFTIHDAMERAEDGIVLQMNNIYHDFMEEDLNFTLNIEQYNQVEWDWIEIDEPTGTIGKGGTLEYEITADVPSDAIKGIYGGKLMIEDETNERTSQIPITITVGEYTDLSDPMEFGAAEGEDDHGIYRNDRLFGSWEGGLTGDWRYYTFQLEDEVGVDEEILLQLDFDEEYSDMSAYLLGGPEHDVLELADYYDEPDFERDAFSLIDEDRYGFNSLETYNVTDIDMGDSVAFVREEPLEPGTYMIVVQSHQISGNDPYQTFEGKLELVDEPNFETKIIDYDEEVRRNETVNVEYGVYNLGGENDTQNITFTVYDDDDVEVYNATEENVTLDIGETYYGSFAWDAENGTDEFGKYRLEVASEDTEDEVDVRVIGFGVEIVDWDEEVRLGETVTVKTNITNHGVEEETQDIIFYVRRVEGIEEVTLEGEESTEIEFEWTPSSLGDYKLLVWSDDHEDSADVTVTGFEIEITDYDEEGVLDENVTVEYNVTNTASTQGTQNITFYVDGAEEDIEENVTLDASDSYEGEFTWTTNVTGMYELRVTSEDDRDTVWVTMVDLVELTINAEEGGTTDPVPGTYTYEALEFVTVEAIPDDGYKFVEWTGDYESTRRTITFRIREDMNITANFRELEEYELTVNIDGQGSVDINPDQEIYEEGTEVTLTADPAANWHFVEWTGDYEGRSRTIYITMDDDKDITAHFEINKHTLTINIEGQGSTDPAEGTHTYDYGEEITVEAMPDEGWEFSMWTGDIGSPSEVVTVTINEDKEITAVFEEEPEPEPEPEEYELTINIDGEGSTNPAEGTHTYEEGEEVTITATPADGWEFVEWTGDYESEDSQITITIDSDMEITAVFEEEPEPDPDEVPGFTTMLLVLAAVIAVAVYYKKEQ